jgi:hypothetical protein
VGALPAAPNLGKWAAPSVVEQRFGKARAPNRDRDRPPRWDRPPQDSQRDRFAQDRPPQAFQRDRTPQNQNFQRDRPPQNFQRDRPSQDRPAQARGGAPGVLGNLVRPREERPRRPHAVDKEAASDAGVKGFLDLMGIPQGGVAPPPLARDRDAAPHRALDRDTAPHHGRAALPRSQQADAQPARAPEPELDSERAPAPEDWAAAEPAPADHAGKPGSARKKDARDRKARGSYTARTADAPLDAPQTPAPRAQPRKAKVLAPVQVDVYIPSVCTVGHLARLLGVRIDVLLRKMVRAGMADEATHDYSPWPRAPPRVRRLTACVQC